MQHDAVAVAPTHAELAARLGITEAEFEQEIARRAREIAAAKVLPLVAGTVRLVQLRAFRQLLRTSRSDPSLLAAAAAGLRRRSVRVLRSRFLIWAPHLGRGERRPSRRVNPKRSSRGSPARGDDSDLDGGLPPW